MVLINGIWSVYYDWFSKRNGSVSGGRILSDWNGGWCRIPCVYAGVPDADFVHGAGSSCLTYTSVREDAIQLYGFLTQQYYDLFALLLSVSGIGPKVAIGILGAARPEDFYLAVQSRDLKMLTKLPGIGKKTAERMVLELKDKIGTLESEENDREFAAAVSGEGKSEAINEAMAALAALGYSNSEILPVLRKIPDYGTLKRDELIRKALQMFAKK